jgi:carboxymethylenebutenolidase
MREIAAGAGRTFDDIDSVRDWLSRQDQCTGKIGVIEFCMRGAYAVALAPGHGYAAASVNCGGCPEHAEQALAGACPIVGSYGGKGRSPMGRSAAPRLEKALTALGVDHDVKVYPSAGQGFINDPDPADVTPLLIFLAKISGTRYHESSAQDARRRHTKQRLITGPAGSLEPDRPARWSREVTAVVGSGLSLASESEAFAIEAEASLRLPGVARHWS